MTESVGTAAPRSLQDDIFYAVWEALEPRLEDVIQLDLNDLHQNLQFVSLVTSVTDAVLQVLPATPVDGRN